MSLGNFVGMGIWVAKKTSELQQVWDLYQTNKSSDTALSVASKLSEIAAGVAAGMAVSATLEAIQKTGLDRVFDSIRKDKSYNDYITHQENWKNFSDYAAGEATDALINWCRNYVSENQTLDPVFSFIDYILNNNTHGGMSAFSAAAAEAATVAPRIDPLVLDLDGDGIETTSTRNDCIILFDHDGDGIKTGTGWVKPDDGWLVLDRNGNGAIDSGHELFGVNTIKSNGQLAKDGFDALKDLDVNQDNKIDSIDEVFANLRIWRDLNQDGISQANELSTLGDNSITAININSTAVRNDLGNGNIQTAAGSFTRSNGTTGITGETSESSAGNLDLLVSTFYRQFTTRIPLSDQAKSLPSLRGSGQVRDLNEAISLSIDLGNTVASYTQQTTRQDQINQLDHFIDQWANTSEMKSLKEQANALANSGVTLTYQIAGLAAGSQAYEDFIHKLGVVERFMGFTYAGARGQPRFTNLDENTGTLTVSLAGSQIDNISLAYERFKTDIYESLLIQTRLQGYFEKLDISLKDNKVVLNFQPVEEAFKAAVSLNPREGIIDLIEFLSAVGETRLPNLNWNATDFLISQLNTAPNLGPFSEELSSWIVRFAAANEHNHIGSSRADLIIATDSVDTIRTGDGNDIILGKGGDDAIYGGSGKDQILGGQGNDYINGEEGNDFIDGGEGNDTINDYYGFNTIKGGDGNDTITSQGIIEGGKGNDVIYALDGDNQIDGGDGDDTIFSSYGNNVIKGGEGNDTITARGIIEGGKGDDVINSLDTWSGDTYIFNLGDGKDTIHDFGLSYAMGHIGAGLDDTLKFGEGIEASAITLERSGDDLIFKFSATDQVNIKNWFYSAFEIIEYVEFANGTKWTIENLKKLSIINIANSISETLNGWEGIDKIYGLGGNDTIYGYAGDDILDGGEGNDTIDGGRGNDQILGGAGDDTIIDNYGVNTIFGGEGNDTIIGGDSNDFIDGGNGNDIITDSYGFNIIKGGDGDDTITSQGIIEGGKGDDVITASDYASGDTYIFNLGDGKDTINDYGISNALGYPGIGLDDTIKFGEGIEAANVALSRNGNNLVFKINETDQVTIKDWFSHGFYQIEKIQFANGTSWSIDTLREMAISVDGTERDDVLYGWNGKNIINGAAGNDIITGGYRNDVIDGGDGNDTITDEYGFNSIKGGDGNDTITARGIFEGGKGDDVITASDYTSGDTYIFNLGDGKDTIRDYGISNALGYSGNGLDDTIQFGEGIDASAVSLARNGNDLIFKISETDQLTIKDWFSHGFYQIEKIQFANGTSWSIDTLRDMAIPFDGSASDDILHGWNGKNFINGAAGNDIIYGDSMSDVIDGGNGNDRLYAYAGADRLLGGDGNDELYGDDGADVLDGGEGNDYLIGGDGADILDGGEGNDYLDGGMGSDIYQFHLGSGEDVINDYDYTDNTDVVSFTDVASTDLTSIELKGYNLVITYGKSDSLTLGNYFYGSSYRIEQFKFSDGVTWNVTDIKSRVMTHGDDNDNFIYGYNYGSNRIYGLGGNDYLDGGDSDDVIDGGTGDDKLYGNAGADNLFGGLGNDYLIGGDGADVLNGGEGNDNLDGGMGSDIYQFHLGSGKDVINDYDYTDNTDVVSFTDVASTDITSIERKNYHLVITYGNSDSLTLGNYFYGSSYRIEQIKFSDGVTWNEAAIKARVMTHGDESNNEISGYNGGSNRIFGLGGDDYLSGGDSDDVIDGGTGNDRLYGNSGADNLIGGLGNDELYGGYDADVLDGGEGNDYLDGGMGSDTYQFGLGSGKDVIDDYDYTDNTDVVSFTDITSSDVTSIERKRDNLIINYGKSDSLTLGNYFYGSSYRIEQFKFSDGVTWDVTDIKSRVMTRGDDNDNSIYGYNYGSNRIYGLGGDDYLAGGDSDDVIDGGMGNDRLYGNSGADNLFGGLGNDDLYGGYDADVLDGGEGNDYLDGGTGNDIYQFHLGSGKDVINDYDYADNTDVVSFTDVTSLDVTSIERKGYHLVITYGKTDSLTLGNYFYGSSYRIEQFKFSDGVTWNEAAIKSRVMTYGDESNNEISGYNGGSNRIYGLGGDDYLAGGDSDDVIDGGTGNDRLYGSDGADNLFGGLGNDDLYGGYDADVLDGGEGNDYLDGGIGNDTYQFGLGSGLDRVSDYDYQSGNNDVLSVGRGVEANQIWLRRVDNDLEVSIIGTGDKTTISNWYYGSSYHIEEFKTSDGKTLLDSQVDALVSAMAAFAPPKAGETTLPADYQNTLNAVIAANWK